MEIGEKIYARRNELGMTQEELSIKIGYRHKSSINKIETGECDVPRDKVKKFAEALNLSVEYLMGWTSAENIEYSEMQKQAIEEILALPQDKLAGLIALLKQ